MKLNEKPKNVKEFKELITRYSTITLEEIQGAWDDEDDVPNKLTGFGKTSTCTFLDVVDCKFCVYGFYYECLDQPTYEDILLAKTPEALLKAFRARAEFMKAIVKKQKL